MFNNDYSKIMTDANGKAKTNINGKLQEVSTIYDVFKGSGAYLAPEISLYCSKTANQVAYYIYKNIAFNETSFNLVPKEVIQSNIVTAKTPNRIREAIKELVDFGVIISWNNIETLKHYKIEANQHMYLLNPLLIRKCSARSFKRNCEVTKDKINNSVNRNSSVYINEQDAIVYSFTRMSKLNIPGMGNIEYITNLI